MITLTSDRPTGRVLRDLRHRRGLSLRQVALRAHLTPSAVLKRENTRSGYVGILIQHARALGYEVALVPRGAGRYASRETGTGWPR